MKNLPDFTDRLEQLISAASISSSNPKLDMSNKEVVTKLASWLEDLGFSIQIQDIPLAPGKSNLIARLGTGPGGLILSGHTDTVPYDQNGWNSDPFTLYESNQAFYGLGTTDMKGFFSVVIDAIQALNGATPKKPLTIVATADEECSMSGARVLDDADVASADFAIIGEPTDLKPIRMHKGIMMEAIRITGQSGHSSNPELGANALEAMQDVMAELRKFRSRIQSAYTNTGFDIAVPTLNMGCIHGGDSANRICGSCDLQFDLRPLPGMSIAGLREDIDTLIVEIAERHGVSIVHEQLFDGVDAFEQAEDTALVSDAEAFSGMQAASVAYATEAPFYKAMGVDTIVLGPGSIDQAHQPNEFLPQKQIVPGAKLYGQFIKRYCF